MPFFSWQIEGRSRAELHGMERWGAQSHQTLKKYEMRQAPEWMEQILTTACKREGYFSS